MNRLQRFARWVWPLLALAGTVYAVWRLYFQRHHVTPAGDPWLWVGIGVAYLVAIVAILITTERWNLTGLGQIATYTADTTFYLGIGLGQYGWRHTITIGEINMGRAELAVGGPCIVIGLLWYAVAAWRNRPHPLSVEERAVVAAERTASATEAIADQVAMKTEGS